MTKTSENFITDRFFWILALVSGFMVYLMGQGVGFTVGPDGNDYVAAAFQLFEPQKYGQPTDYVGPFYATFLRILFAIGQGWVFQVVHHYLPAFFVPIIIYFALKPFHQTAAFFCGLLIAIDVNSMFHFACICSEAPYIFWLAVVLWSFCRLVQDPKSPFAAYGHGLSLVMLTLTRAAGRFLFIVLLPFYALVFKSGKLLRRLLLIFLIPMVILYVVFLIFVPTLKFPSAIVPLNFLHSYGLINPNSTNLHRMMDVAEQTYFEHPLSSDGHAQLWDDYLTGNGMASNLLYDVCWSAHPKEFDQAVNDSFWEAVRGLSIKDYWRIFKIYKHGIYIHSEFTPVPMIYTHIFPYDGNRPYYDSRRGIDSRLQDYLARYGTPINKAMADSFYKKYGQNQDDYRYFNEIKPQSWAVVWLGRISMIFPFFVSRWVFFLAVFFLFVRGREFKQYQLVAVFGIILFLYNYALTMLFGPHERYRAPMDMFYFIPVAWLYAFLIFDKNWKSPWKIIGWVLLPIMIVVNVHEMSSILRDWYLQSAFLHFGAS